MRTAAVALAFLFAFTACTKVGTEASGRHAWTHPGLLRVAVTQEPKTLNALLAATTVDSFIDRFMFEPLVSADPRGNSVPMLAAAVPTQTNGGISRDGLTITYHLRSGMKWTDGTPVTSNDVKASWAAIMNSANDVVSRHGYDYVRSLDTPNATTVVVRLKERFAPFVDTFFAESDQPYDILPASVLATSPDMNHIDFNAAPTKSDGPFRFVAWHRGDSVDLIANPSFFRGAPKITRVHIAFVPDENTATNLLRTHEIDYIYQPTINTYPVLSTLPDARVVFNNMNGYEGMMFNLSHPVVADPRVRRAIAMGIDKASLAARLTHGQEKVATEDLPDWMWAYDHGVQAVQYDPTAARALLAQAGWKPGPDGIVRKNGVPMQLLLVTDTQTATHRDESLLVQAALRRIGVGVSVKYYPQDILYAPAGMGGIVHGGKFDLVFWPWFAGVDPDDSSQFTCRNIPPYGYNDSRYCNPEMESAQQAALTHYGRVMRAGAYARVESLLARDNPLVFFWWNRTQEAISVDFKGFAPNPTVESWNAWQWSL
jgi:peptide/nickel transport system substrate-binding protein